MDLGFHLEHCWATGAFIQEDCAFARKDDLLGRPDCFGSAFVNEVNAWGARLASREMETKLTSSSLARSCCSGLMDCWDASGGFTEDRCCLHAFFEATGLVLDRQSGMSTQLPDDLAL